MASHVNSEETIQEEIKGDSILYFPKDITTEEGLEIIRQRKFKCGYHYTIEEDGRTIVRAIFYNHKNDLLSIRFTEEQFYLPEESNRLYINRQIPLGQNQVKAKHFPPINPFKEYSHTKSVIPKEAQPIDINNIDNIIDYQLRLIPDNYEIEIYRRKRIKEIEQTIENSSKRAAALENLNHIIQLANLYKFEETYSELDEVLKVLYKPLLEIHKSEFYSRVVSLIECNRYDEIITELLNLLGIALDKDIVLKELTEKKEYTNNSLIQKLKKLKERIISMSEDEDIISRITRHSEWFEHKEVVGHTLKLRMPKSRI